MSTDRQPALNANSIPDAGVRALFAQPARWQSWLDVEAALAQAEAALGIIPEAAAAEITAKARLELLDQERIAEGLQRTGHRLVPLVWELARVCEGDAGGYVHWGATTQNIVQTGDLLMLREAHGIFLRLIADILEAMADLAERSHDAPIPGRTHGQHAVPLTFGFKVAVWIDEMCRHAERLRQAEPRVFVAMLGGAAGTFASFGAEGPAVQARMAELLGMQPMAMPSRTLIDHLAEYVCLLGLLAASGGKIGHEVYTLMKQEFGEVEEPVPPGAVGSSTMPQKRNPRFSQDMMTDSSKVRALVPLALEAMQIEHEADRGRTVVMRHAVQEACVGTGDLLTRLHLTVAGMRLDTDRMRRNLDLTDGLIMGESLMLALGRHIGRQEAHDVIYDAAQAAFTTSRPFRELLAADAHVQRHLSAGEIEELLDPVAYTGLCSTLAREQAQRAREAAAALRSV